MKKLYYFSYIFSKSIENAKCNKSLVLFVLFSLDIYFFIGIISIDFVCARVLFVAPSYVGYIYLLIYINS